MGYATLMAHLELGHPNTALLNIACTLADRFNAGVIGIAVCQPIRVLYTDGYVQGDVIRHDRDEIDTEIKAAEAEFRAALADKQTTIEWRSEITYEPLSDCLARIACCADLVLTGLDPSPSVFDTSHHVDVGDLVMQAGRPCLVVPPNTANLALEHVVVGWKDTAETRRAIRDALPLLQAAKRVSVVAVADRKDLAAAEARLRDVLGWLKRHAIDATAIAAPSTGNDAVRLNAILQEQDADLLVAGAYGHSRVREWALGGVTRDLLLRAERCVLVSH